VVGILLIIFFQLFAEFVSAGILNICHYQAKTWAKS